MRTRAWVRGSAMILSMGTVLVFMCLWRRRVLDRWTPPAPSSSSPAPLPRGDAEFGRDPHRRSGEIPAPVFQPSQELRRLLLELPGFHLPQCLPTNPQERPQFPHFLLGLYDLGP